MKIKTKSIILLLLVFTSVFFFKFPANAIVVELDQPLTNEFIEEENLNKRETKEKIIALIKSYKNLDESDFKNVIGSLTSEMEKDIDNVTITSLHRNVNFVPLLQCAKCDLIVSFNDKALKVTLKGQPIENYESILIASKLPCHRRKTIKGEEIESISENSRPTRHRTKKHISQ